MHVVRGFRGLRTMGACALAAALFAGQGCAADATSRLPQPSGSRSDHVYVYNEQMVGLSETVSIRKTPLGAVVTRADGRVESLAAVREKDRVARIARFGAMKPAFASIVASTAPDSELRVQVHASLGDGYRAIARRLASTDKRVRIAAQHDLRQLTEVASNRLVQELKSLGVRDAKALPGMPAATGAATASLVRRLARLPNVTFVSGAAPGRLVPYSAGNAVVDAQIDVAFNDHGHHGQGQKVGTLEMGQTGLYEPHDALADLEQDPSTGYRVTYMDEPPDCLPSIGCGPDVDCVDIGHSGHAEQCVANHASRTASVFTDAPFGASRARLYYANTPEWTAVGGYDVACSVDAIANGYAWFVVNGVTTTWESWGCQHPLNGQGDAEGIPQDYFARNYDISIFKAAGNQQDGDAPEEPACPYTANSVCVGAHTGVTASPQMVATFSSWTNYNGPSPFAGYGNPTDREEPDLVARGVMVDTMDIAGGTGAWNQSSGTSFSAPAAAAVATLMKERCGEGGDMHHLLVHAVLRNSAYVRNMRDFRYSTPDPLLPGLSRDWRDGAGALDALAARWHCDGESEDGAQVTIGLLDGNLEEGVEAPFSDCTHCGESTPLGGKSGNYNLKSYNAPGPGDSRMYHHFWNSGTSPLAENTRIRATIVWDACPASYTGVAPAPNATDIDLVLVNKTNGYAVTISQSVQDNVEGFDVEIQDEGEYDLYWTSPEGALGCGDTGMEPLAFSVVWGTF